MDLYSITPWHPKAISFRGVLLQIHFGQMLLLFSISAIKCAWLYGLYEKSWSEWCLLSSCLWLGQNLFCVLPNELTPTFCLLSNSLLISYAFFVFKLCKNEVKLELPLKIRESGRFREGELLFRCRGIVGTILCRFYGEGKLSVGERGNHLAWWWWWRGLVAFETGASSERKDISYELFGGRIFWSASCASSCGTLRAGICRGVSLKAYFHYLFYFYLT